MALHRLGGTAVFHFMAQLHLQQHCWEPSNQQLGARLLRGKHVATWRQTPERHRQRKAPVGASQHLTQLHPTGRQELEFPLLFPQGC